MKKLLIIAAVSAILSACDPFPAELIGELTFPDELSVPFESTILSSKAGTYYKYKADVNFSVQYKGNPEDIKDVGISLSLFDNVNDMMKWNCDDTGLITVSLHAEKEGSSKQQISKPVTLDASVSIIIEPELGGEYDFIKKYNVRLQ